MQEFFKLMEGEEIIKSIKPKPALFWYFLIMSGGIVSIIVFIILINLAGMLYALATGEKTQYSGLVIALGFIGILLIILLIPVIIAWLRYKKQYYWITNRRVLVKRGIIGYSVYAIPLERISDIIISRSFMESLFGFGSLMIQTLAGQVSFGYGRRGRFGAEGTMLALQEPEETQELIFNLIKENRKRLGLKF